MKITFISTISDYPWGGADFLWTRAAEAAADRGAAVQLVVSPATANHPRLAALAARGAALCLRTKPVVPTSLGARLSLRLRRWTGSADAVVNAVRRFRPDLMIISCGGTYDLAHYPAWVDWLLSSRTKFRVVANWQSEAPKLAAPELEQIVRIFPAADALCFVSTRNLASTRRHLRLPLPNARVIQNPLRWQPADLAPWPHEDGAGLATVSRLDEGKGIHVLLQALAEAGTALPAWRLSIFGEGPFGGRLRQLATGLGLDDRVRFRGHVRELATIWGEHHLMISPALDDGVPMTIPEAMLCQRPVLATRVGPRIGRPARFHAA